MKTVNDNPIVEIRGQRIAVVPQDHMTTDEVRAIQEEIVDKKLWDTMPWLDPKDSRSIVMISKLPTDELEVILLTKHHLSVRRKAIVLELLKRRYRSEGGHEAS
ncbi:MAG: hypothetical protein HUJ26_00385 [Planctomycetaceae bacterium]|nr:hypothetical protein [Planctomycetaceae bacterium]